MLTILAKEIITLHCHRHCQDMVILFLVARGVIYQEMDLKLKVVICKLIHIKLTFLRVLLYMY